MGLMFGETPAGQAQILAEDLALNSGMAEVVAHFAEGRLEGRPAVVRNQTGAGHSWYVGADLPPEALEQVVADALESAGIAYPLDVPLPEHVEAASRGGQLFLLNHSGEPQQVRLGWASVDLLTGAAHGDELTLPPFGALVLRTFPRAERSKQRNSMKFTDGYWLHKKGLSELDGGAVR
jgi:beta-galactosidase